jgi:ribonuclease Z
MGAENVILTHFSSRYPHMPSYLVNNANKPSSPSSPKGVEMTIALAFDHARMRVGDLWKIPRYLKAIEQSFADTKEEGDEEEEKDLLAANAEQ